jgi:MICOS complex subunit MIC19
LIELQVQARVAEELQKLQKQESKAFEAAREKLASAAPDAAGEKPSTTSHIVSKEVQDLRRRLEERKQVRQLPEAVEGARSDVIRCLTENDRRPLDCWQEVEKFKAEVKKLENSWVDKVVS